MDFNNKIPVVDNNEEMSLSATAACRCCLLESSNKSLASKHIWNGKRVAYADLIKHTFGLTLSPSKDLTQLLCDTCISQIIGASEFKKQVQECEAVLRKQFGLNDEPEPKLKKGSKFKRFASDDFLDDFIGFDNYDDDFAYLSKICQTPKLIPTLEPGIERQMKMIEKKLNMPIVLRHLLSAPIKRREKKSASYSHLKAVKVGDKIKYYKTKQPSSTTLGLKASKVGDKTTYYLTRVNSVISAGEQNDCSDTTSAKDEPVEKEPKKNKANKNKKVSTKFSLKNEYAEMHENGKIILLHTTAYPFWFSKPYTSLQCAYCKEPEIEFTGLKSHMEQNHEVFNPDKAFQNLKDRVHIKVDCSDLKCRICDHPFNGLDVIAKHLKDDHDINVSLTLDFGLIPYKFQKNKVLTCAVCETPFKNYMCLNKHMGTHFLTFMCDQCGKSLSSRGALKTHQMFSHNEKSLCYHCKTSFDTRAEMNAHYKNTYECWNYSCKLCGEKFARGTQKQSHMIATHGSEYSMQCSACPERFTKRIHLDAHFLKYHSDDMSPKCHVCDKAFLTEKMLGEHMSSHTGATPYQCQQCSKQYATKKALAQHIKINHRHHFSCEECNKHFGCKSSLLNHNSTHH